MTADHDPQQFPSIPPSVPPSAPPVAPVAPPSPSPAMPVPTLPPPAASAPPAGTVPVAPVAAAPGVDPVAPAVAPTPAFAPAPMPTTGTPESGPPPGGAGDPVPAGYTPFDPGASDVELLPAHVVRIIWIIGQVLSVPLAFIGVGAAASAVVTTLALPVWSGLVGVNIRRVKPATQHAAAPRPAWLALSWFAPVAVVVGMAAALFVLARVGDRDATGIGADELSIRDLSVLIVVAGVVIVLFSLFVPYAAHRRAARWVGGDPSSFTKWFWAPIISALLASIAFGMIGRLIVSSGSEVSYAAAALAIAALSVPGLVYVIMGNRALSGLEEATAATATRRNLEGRSPSGMTAAQIAAITGQGVRS